MRAPRRAATLSRPRPRANRSYAYADAVQLVRVLHPASKSWSGGEAEDQLSRLGRHVELRAVADAVELDPIGVRQPFPAKARRRLWPRQQLVLWFPTRSASDTSIRSGVHAPAVADGVARSAFRAPRQGDDAAQLMRVVARRECARSSVAIIWLCAAPPRGRGERPPPVCGATSFSWPLHAREEW